MTFKNGDRVQVMVAANWYLTLNDMLRSLNRNRVPLALGWEAIVVEAHASGPYGVTPIDYPDSPAGWYPAASLKLSPLNLADGVCEDGV